MDLMQERLCPILHQDHIFSSLALLECIDDALDEGTTQHDDENVGEHQNTVLRLMFLSPLLEDLESLT